MNRIIHWSCSSCGLRNGEVQYQDWGFPEEQVKAVVRGIRVEHSRISDNCISSQIWVFYEKKVIPFWKLERIVEGLKT